LAVFLGVACNPYSTPTMSVRVVPPTRLQYRLKSSISFDPTVGSRLNFRGVFGGCFPWSSVESLLQDDDVRSGRTTNSTTGLKTSITFDPIVGSHSKF